MRMWSVTPAALDAKALVACWRESLLAQAVLLGKTKGYVHHPQLTRFRETPDPVVSIATFLSYVADEADRRGYHFNRERIVQMPDPSISIDVSDAQLAYEWRLLLIKESQRDTKAYRSMTAMPVGCNPLFRVVQGAIAPWEHVLDLDALDELSVLGSFPRH
ncbi:pyrimidine dimer DNA glycosylase/endonuclease V [Bifidobacterium aquikefiri]|uniref:pyrimidine dimer DNA glycosylase/endonuclease V n=2 Tax=Bifidobacterium aquikefiri TaxID=1653207 RepID=UPI0039EB5AA2